MTTNHRAKAENHLRHCSVSLAWPHIALHAIDRLADALDARLPQTPPPSTLAAPVSDEDTPCERCGK